MPAPAYTPDPKGTATDTPRPDNSWYKAFSNPAEDATAQPAPADAIPETSVPDPLDTLTLSDIPGPHARGGVDSATLPALLQVQHAELERLAQDNRRLMDRIETLLQIQGREQVLRQQLQNQVERIGEHMKLSPPAETLEAVRREARAGVAEEIKPVLMAILDALERFAGEPARKGKPISVESAEPADPYMGEDYGKLPLILTRPIGELMEDVGDPGRSHSGAMPGRTRKNVFQNRNRVRPPAPAEREGATNTGPFTWTTVFTS